MKKFRKKREKKVQILAGLWCPLLLVRGPWTLCRKVFEEWTSFAPYLLGGKFVVCNRFSEKSYSHFLKSLFFFTVTNSLLSKWEYKVIFKFELKGPKGLVAENSNRICNMFKICISDRKQGLGK